MLDARATDNTTIPEYKRPGARVITIVGRHATSVDDFEQNGAWSKNVRVQLQAVQPRCIVPDGLDGNVFHSTYAVGIDLPKLNFTEIPTIIGADITFPFEITNDLSGDLRKWLATRDGVLRLHNSGVTTDYNKASEMMYVRHLLAEPVLIGASLFVGSLIFAQRQPLSRRAFLSYSAGVGAGIVHGMLLNKLDADIEKAKPEDSKGLFALAQYLKPAFLELGYLDLRNLKIGIIAQEEAARLHQAASSKPQNVAVVLGEMHSFVTDPSSPLDVLEKRLLSYLKDMIPALEASELARSRSELEIQLTETMAQYIRYETNQDGTWTAQRRPSPTIARLVAEAFG